MKKTKIKLRKLTFANLPMSLKQLSVIRGSAFLTVRAVPVQGQGECDQERRDGDDKLPAGDDREGIDACHPDKDRRHRVAHDDVIAHHS